MTQQTILIADDDPVARELVVQALDGFRVIAAADGQEAERLFISERPDLVILDVIMPGKTGIEVCQTIKQQEHTAHTPVLLLTAQDDLQDKVKGLSAGADDYLTKPFAVKELQARVQALLRVRAVNVLLLQKNEELKNVQAAVVDKERQLAVMQLGGTAAHALGQPLAAIMLNVHLLEKIPAADPRFAEILTALKSDARRMADLIEKLRRADASKKQPYHGATEILDLEDKKK